MGRWSSTYRSWPEDTDRLRRWLKGRDYNVAALSQNSRRRVWLLANDRKRRGRQTRGRVIVPSHMLRALYEDQLEAIEAIVTRDGKVKTP